MNHCWRKYGRNERGYVLLVLLLAMAVLSIGLAVAIPKIEFEVRRDREEEMIHRGVQYSRAVRRFIKAFGRYPSRIEELESTNNIRFLRKRYKDPITGKDFKILHLRDLPSFIPVPPIASVAKRSAQRDSSSGTGNGGSEGQDGSPNGESSDDQATEGAPSQTVANGSNTSLPPQSAARSVSSNDPNLGMGPIIGVVSISKKKTIREFNKKNHYNEWQFIYDPSTDAGVLLNTPSQPILQKALQLNNREGN